MAERAKAGIEITASSNRLTAGLAKARATITRWAGGMARGIGKIGAPAIGTAIGTFAGNLATKGFDSIVDQGKQLIDLERSLTRYQIAAGKTPEAMNAFKSSIRAASRETAIGSADILAGAQTYIDLTGDIDGAEKAMKSFARIAQASGSSVSDIATATASMQMTMGLQAGDIEKVFSGLITQGKVGAISLKDMASELSTLGPMMSKFQNGTGAEGIATMGAAFQVVRQGAGSAAEANTQLQGLITGIVKHAKDFEKVGVQIYNKDPKTGVKTLKPFADIIDGISESKLMKDPTALGKAFGRVEALAAFQSLTRNKALYDELIQKAKTSNAVQADMQTYLQSNAGKIETAFNNVKLSLAEAFTPERITAFVNALTKVADAMVKVVGLLDAAATKAAEVWEMINGPSVEKRADKMTKGRIAEFNKTKNIGGYRTREEMEQHISNPEMRASLTRSESDFLKDQRKKVMRENAELNSKPSLNETEQVSVKSNEQYMEFLDKQIAALDPWNQGGGINKEQMLHRSAMAPADKFDKYDRAQFVDPVAQEAAKTAQQMLTELQKMAALLAGKTTLVADGNAIATSGANATDTRRAP